MPMKPLTYAQKHKRMRTVDLRPGAHKRGYGFSWRKLRTWYAARNPLCVRCLERDVIKPMDIVDHILPLSDGGAQLDQDNLQSLCNRCHQIKHA